MKRGGDENITVEGQTERQLPLKAGKVRRSLVKEALKTIEEGEPVGPNEFRYWNYVKVESFPDPEGEIDRAIDIARSIHEAGIADKIKPLLEDDL